MSHYDVLGVAPSASHQELRQAYLRLVRELHPDRHAIAGPEEFAAAENAMRAVNAAWHDLGDSERRRRYDERLALRPRSVVVDHDGSSTWSPFDDGEDVIDDRLDDSDRPPPRGGRLLAMGPAAVLIGGMVVMVVGLAISVRPLAALGAMAVILGGALFLLATISVMFESRRNDLR